MLKERTDRAWFSRLLRHMAKKCSESILTTPEPARAKQKRDNVQNPGLLRPHTQHYGNTNRLCPQSLHYAWSVK